MINIPLQFNGIGIGILVGTGLNLLSTVLGGVITYIAFQGYRRNSSRPMLFVAGGFFFVFVVPFLLSVGSTLIVTAGGAGPIVAQISAVAGIITEISRVSGLLSILYGLRMPLRQ